MAKKNPDKPKDEEPEREDQCSYVSVKIDDELPPLIRIAAARMRKTVQEYMSDVLNDAVKRDTGEGIARRRPPRDK